MEYIHNICLYVRYVYVCVYTVYVCVYTVSICVCCPSGHMRDGGKHSKRHVYQEGQRPTSDHHPLTGWWGTCTGDTHTHLTVKDGYTV